MELGGSYIDFDSVSFGAFYFRFFVPFYVLLQSELYVTDLSPDHQIPISGTARF